jgi:hypothetical protein
MSIIGVVVRYPYPKVIIKLETRAFHTGSSQDEISRIYGEIKIYPNKT